MKLLKIKISIILILLFVCFCLLSCDNNNKTINNSVYNHIMNMKPVSSYEQKHTIDDFDTLTLGEIEQYDDRNGEKQGIEWLLLYRDEEKALFQSKYIIAAEPYVYEWLCPTYEEYLKSNSYADYNALGEWVNSQYRDYIEKNDFGEKTEELLPNYFSAVSKNDKTANKSPFIYDWLDDTFYNEIFNEEEKELIRVASVSEFNHNREVILKKRKMTLMTLEDSKKYYGEIYASEFSNTTESSVNNRIRTKPTKAVISLSKNYLNGTLYEKGSHYKSVYFKPNTYYLNTMRLDDSGYIQGDYDAVSGISYDGKSENLVYHSTFHNTGGVFGGSQSEDTLRIAGVRPCIWIDLKKSKNKILDKTVNVYEDLINKKNEQSEYSLRNKNIKFVKKVKDYDDNSELDEFDIVQLGRFNDKMINYRQYDMFDDETSDNPIEWIVLDKSDTYLLLLSKYVLTTMPYSENGNATDFENSSLNKWLNTRLLDKIFNEDEKNQIFGVNKYNDKIFLLDEEMIKKYFTNDEGEYCNKKAATKAVPNSRLKVSGTKYNQDWNNFNVNYLIDSQGDFDGLVKYIDYNGEINDYGVLLDNVAYGIRPAIFVSYAKQEGNAFEVIDKNSKKIDRYWKSVVHSTPSIIERAGDDIKYDTVFFGKYEQDGISENGSEDIEWYVLDKKDNKVLLFSKYIIESGLMCDGMHMPSYKDSFARNKLLDELYDKFFDDSEKRIIVETEFNNFDCPLIGVSQTDNYILKDKIFLLSLEDIRRYFGYSYESSEVLKSKATYYVTDVKNVNRGIYDRDVKNHYWLRTPGYNAAFASSMPTLDYLFGLVDSYTTMDSDINNCWGDVDSDGQFAFCSAYVELDNSNRGGWFSTDENNYKAYYSGIRPAIWVDEEKLNEYEKEHIVNQYIYEDNREKKNVYEFKDVLKAKTITEYSNSYGYEDFDTVKFGKFSFDPDKKEKNDIEWFVLEKNDDSIVLMSKYILKDLNIWKKDDKDDHNTDDELWEYTDCFNWLNNDFIKENFSKEEQDKILTTSYTLKTQRYSTTMHDDYVYERDVKSKVSLLNVLHIEKYFKKNEYKYEGKINILDKYYNQRLVAKKFGKDKFSPYWMMEGVTGGTAVSWTNDIINKIGVPNYASSNEVSGIRPIIVIDAKKLKK